MTRTRRGWTVPGVLLGAALISGCGGDGSSAEPGSWAGTVRDSVGIAIVENPSTGLWSDGDRWTVSEVLRIGTSAGDPDYQFGQISGIAELADGRIAVFDAQAQYLRFFSADGTYDRTIGGPGSGPGEFALGAGPVLVGLADTLVIPDVTNRRVNRFDPSGKPLDSYPLDLAAGIPLAWLDREDGAIFNQLRPLDFPGAEPSDGNDVLVLRQSDGTIVDTVLVIESGGTIKITDSGGQIEFFAPEPIWALSSDGVIFGVNDDYRLFVYAPDGSVERIVTRPFEAKPVTDGDRELLTDAMMKLYEEFGIAGAALDAVRQALGFADLYPAYALIRGGPAGSIWVQHLRTPGEMSAEELESFNPQLGFGSPNWDVFGSDGRYMGIVQMPERFQPIRFRGDRIYGIWRDELDVQYALILRVDGA